MHQQEAYRELGFQTLGRMLKDLRSKPGPHPPANAPDPELVKEVLPCLQRGQLPTAEVESEM